MIGYDLPRDFTSFLEARIEKGLRERLNKTISFFHYPGVGATTISLRIAWRLKDRYPVVLLKRYRPIETISRCYQLFQTSSLPPLIIIDSENVSLESRSRLQQEALSRNFPVTLLEVQRRLNQPKSLSSDQVYLTEILSDAEVFTFAESYGELAPSKRNDLRLIVNSSVVKEKHPLFFGLTAFEENFRGLKEFVSKAQTTSDANKVKIVAFISLVGIYAQKSIFSQSFASLLSHPESTAVKLEAYLTESLLHLIVNDGNFAWRPLHYLVAKEFLKVYFGGEESQMNIGLSELAIEFIVLIGSRDSKPTSDEYDILNRLFIERVDEDFGEDDDRPFSKLIQDGMSDSSGRLRVLTKLTEVFPDQPHYWSHLARFYNLIVKDQAKALECIETAIDIDKEEGGRDATLYHIKGMILKSQAAAIMQKNAQKIDEGEFGQIRSLILSCNIQFQISRDINPNSDYGYITNIDAITHYLDFRFRHSKFSDDRSKFIKSLDSFDLRLFAEARMLLEDLSFKLHHNPRNFYYVRAKNKIHEYFANYSSIIQSWQNLLSSANFTDRLSIRQNLVHAYVGRAGGWEKLPQKDIEKIIRLLDENINNDPTNGKNIFLWFKAARHFHSIRTGEVVQKLVKWKSLEPSIEVSFYLSTLYVVEAIKGNSLSAKLAIQLIREVSEKSRFHPYRTFLSEWYCKGNELGKILPRSAVVLNNDSSRDLTFDLFKLEEVLGKVSYIKGPEIGEIEFASGLTASFIPARADSNKGLVIGRDENKDVRFFLGFSYDGLKAFEVMINDKPMRGK